MIDLQDVLTGQDVRRLNLDLFFDQDEPYLRTGPFGDKTDREVEQQIRNVRGAKLRRVIEAVAPFDEQSLPRAWSHFMACMAGTHPFPDANHRTGMLAFAQATAKAFNVLVGLEPEKAYDMGTRSKALRDPHRQTLSRARFYTVAELADPTHPYRMHFAGYEPFLVLVDMEA